MIMFLKKIIQLITHEISEYINLIKQLKTLIFSFIIEQKNDAINDIKEIVKSQDICLNFFFIEIPTFIMNKYEERRKRKEAEQLELDRQVKKAQSQKFNIYNMHFRYIGRIYHDMQIIRDIFEGKKQPIKSKPVQREPDLEINFKNMVLSNWRFYTYKYKKKTRNFFYKIYLIFRFLYMKWLIIYVKNYYFQVEFHKALALYYWIWYTTYWKTIFILVYQKRRQFALYYLSKLIAFIIDFFDLWYSLIIFFGTGIIFVIKNIKEVPGILIAIYKGLVEGYKQLKHFRALRSRYISGFWHYMPYVSNIKRDFLPTITIRTKPNFSGVYFKHLGNPLNIKKCVINLKGEPYDEQETQLRIQFYRKINCWIFANNHYADWHKLDIIKVGFEDLKELLDFKYPTKFFEKRDAFLKTLLKWQEEYINVDPIKRTRMKYHLAHTWSIREAFTYNTGYFFQEEEDYVEKNYYYDYLDYCRRLKKSWTLIFNSALPFEYFRHIFIRPFTILYFWVSRVLLNKTQNPKLKQYNTIFKKIRYLLRLYFNWFWLFIYLIYLTWFYINDDMEIAGAFNKHDYVGKTSYSLAYEREFDTHVDIMEEEIEHNRY